MDLPATLGPYRIEREIARGPASVVMLARPPRGEAPVVLKAWRPSAALDSRDFAELRERFLREAEVLATLRHPGIVHVLDAGVFDALLVHVLEAIPGVELARYARPPRLLPPGLVAALLAQVAEALHFAHERGVVHRDVKPPNLIVDLPRRAVVLTDFGAARLADAERSRSGLIVGTPAYMAPEVLAGRESAAPADLYALGVVAFELLAGALPYAAESLGALLAAIAAGTRRPLAAAVPGLDRAWVELVEALLAHEPDARPRAAAVAPALRRLAG